MGVKVYFKHVLVYDETYIIINLWSKGEHTVAITVKRGDYNQVYVAQIKL